MAKSVIVDTDILIDFSLDRPDAVQKIAILEENYTILVSIVTAKHIYSSRSETVRISSKKKRP